MSLMSVISLISLLAVSIAFSGNDESNKVDKEVLELLKQQDEVSVIVVLKDDYDVLNEYSVSALNKKSDFEKKKMMIKKQQEKVLKSINLNKKQIDFKLKRRFSSVNGLSGEVTEQGLQKLLSNPNVKRIYPNRPVRAFLSDSKNIVNASKTWGLIYNGINITGKGETVCIIDTGVDYTHPNMGDCASTSNINDGSCAKVIGGYDFINNDQDPIDDHGHGTHVAGIVASNNETYRGIAPDANIVAIKSLDSTGSGTTGNIIDGLIWCTDNSSIFNITVISMSLGSDVLFATYCDNDDPLTAAAIDAAVAKNISVTAATGNDGNTTGIASPACIKNTTAVASSTKSDGISSFSNRNSITDLFAPGSSITSLKIGGGTLTASGTSMATPHVAAAFALLRQFKRLESNEVLTPKEIQAALNNAGKQIDDTSGSGLLFSRINVFAALLSLDTQAPVINITFSNPINNSSTTNNYIYVNISSTEILLTASLEINGTNNTMNGSGLNWYINKTGLTNGTYTYRIYGTDFAENIGISDTRIVTILNNVTNIASFNISLNQGWNLISIPLNLSNNSIDYIFSSIENNYSKILTYNSSDIGNEWRIYDKNNLNKSNLENIEMQNGIWIQMLQNGTLSLSGTAINNITYNLKQGLNLISYPLLNEKNTSVVFSQINSSLNNVLSYEDNNWLSYSPLKNELLNTLKKVKPGFGYLVNVNGNVSLTFV